MGEAVAAGTVLDGFPVGRRTPRGKRRWYLVHAPGREQATCDKLKRAVPADLLDDAFVMRKERWRKYGDEWRSHAVPLYQDYFFVATRDVVGLDKAMGELTFPVSVAKADSRHYAPMAAEAQAWYERMMDDEHVIRSSTGVIVDGVLDVQAGPLVGQEARVTKVVRPRRYCFVQVTDVDGGFRECVPLVIPFKS